MRHNRGAAASGEPGADASLPVRERLQLQRNRPCYRPPLTALCALQPL